MEQTIIKELEREQAQREVEEFLSKLERELREVKNGIRPLA